MGIVENDDLVLILIFIISLLDDTIKQINGIVRVHCFFLHSFFMCWHCIRLQSNLIDWNFHWAKSIECLFIAIKGIKIFSWHIYKFMPISAYFVPLQMRYCLAGQRKQIIIVFATKNDYDNDIDYIYMGKICVEISVSVCECVHA